MKHVLARTVQMGDGRYRAVCACRHGEAHKDRSTAIAMLYSHIVHAPTAECPTPGKKRHGSREEAENAIMSFLKRPSPGRRPARVYQCPSGQHWHTTKQPDQDAA